MTMLKVSNLKKSFFTEEIETVALNGVSFDVKEGEFVAVMGPSGCGKSTLLNILGLLDNPTSGEYHLIDREVGSLQERDRTYFRRGNIGFVFQSFNLLPRLTAVENVALPLVYSGCSAHQREQRAVKALIDVGLGERLQHKPSELSGGQRQRVAVARALINNPSIVLADEPTGNLDTRTSEEIMALLGELHSNGNTVIVVTHEEDVAAHAKRIVRLRDGKIESDTVI